MAHIMAIPFPAQGHINPLLQFCKLVASHNARVTFVNMDVIQKRIEECSNSRRADGEGGGHAEGDEDGEGRVIMASLPLTGFDLSNGFKLSLEGMAKAAESTADALHHLLTCLSRDGHPVTCIISDIMVTSWTHRLAHLFNLPRFSFCPYSQNTNLFFTYLPSLMAQGYFSMHDAIEGFPHNKQKALTHLHGLPPLQFQHIPTFRHIDNDTEFFYSYFEQQYQQAYKSDGLICNTFYELEKPAIEAMAEERRVYTVGPLFIASRSVSNLWTEEDHCLQWLDKQAPASVLYVSFGSLTLLSAAQFEEIVLGIEASSHPFLWVLRPDLVRDESYNPLEYINGRVVESIGCAVSWSPQLQVLSHPAIGGFLSHCGWNSTLESIANGIPILCWPYFADQMMDSILVAREWKVGMEFEGQSEGFVRREEVKRVVRAVMGGDAGVEMRRGVATLKEEAHKSMMKEGHSYKNLQAFLTDLKEMSPSRHF